MSTLRAKQITKPIDPIRSEGHPLGDVKQEAVIKGLSKLVATSADEPDVGHHILAPVHTLNKSHFDWIRKLIPGIERVAVEYHVGNFVAIRGTDEKVFESMPLYARCVTLDMCSESRPEGGQTRDAPVILRQGAEEAAQQQENIRNIRGTIDQGIQPPCSYAPQD